jgi:hypothetical protein
MKPAGGELTTPSKRFDVLARASTSSETLQWIHVCKGRDGFARASGPPWVRFVGSGRRWTEFELESEPRSMKLLVAAVWWFALLLDEGERLAKEAKRGAADELPGPCDAEQEAHHHEDGDRLRRTGVVAMGHQPQPV